MDPLLLAAGLFAVLAAVGVVAGVFLVLNPDRTAADRIAEFTGSAEDQSPGRSGKVNAFAQSAARLAVSNEEQFAALRRRLLQAGYRDRNAVEIYSAVRTVGAIGLGVLAALLFHKLKLLYLVGSALSGVAIGYYVPALWVSNQLTHRQQDIMKAFPDALDLLVSSVEAGLGVDGAFRRVADEMEAAGPELARELQFVSHEVNAGVPRIEALKHLAERTGLEEVNSLVNVLVQAERFGTSVARSLRIHADLVRTRRMQRAEEKAARVSPTLTIIMILFILPCLLVILIGPAIINVKNILMPSLSSSASQ